MYNVSRADNVLWYPLYSFGCWLASHQPLQMKYILIIYIFYSINTLLIIFENVWDDYYTYHNQYQTCDRPCKTRNLHMVL